jgi:hypothetical protein
VQNHGRAIAHTIATNQPKPFDKIAVCKNLPISFRSIRFSLTGKRWTRVAFAVWSAQGQQLRYCGTTQASSYDDLYIDGKPEELNFVAYYFSTSSIPFQTCPLNACSLVLLI